jgi:hypothetical protein
MRRNQAVKSSGPIKWAGNRSFRPCQLDHHFKRRVMQLGKQHKIVVVLIGNSVIDKADL